MKIAWPGDKLQRILMMSQNGIMLFKATFNDDGTLESIDLLFRNVWVLKYISREFF